MPAEEDTERNFAPVVSYYEVLCERMGWRDLGRVLAGGVYRVGDIAGNPAAEVEVRTSPDGTIVGQRLIKSSGNKAWDSAVLRAIEKTETLPRDVDGRVPSQIVISFRPKD